MKMNLPVSFKGKVLHGRALGRTIGMPTANIEPDCDVSGISKGVYRSRVNVDGKLYTGITNLGCKPTVAAGLTVNIETYLFGFSGDLYDRDITVTLTDFIRTERKFDSVEELSKQMHADMEYVKNMDIYLRAEMSSFAPS